MAWILNIANRTLEVPRLLVETMGWTKDGPKITVELRPGTNTVVLAEADQPEKKIAVIFCRG